jgi:SAM-dependent methyltransferase
MQLGALQPYERSLRSAEPLGLHNEQDGRLIELDVARWLAPVDAADRTVLDRCTPPTLDVGCGPGRFVVALGERGVAAMGLDIAETAVAMTRGRGLPAVLRSVFAPVPGEGRWPTVLLMDGNIGIGGDPARLLRRVRALLCARGRLLVEVHPDPEADELLTVRFSEGDRPCGPSFGWAHVGLSALCRYAVESGYRSGPAEVWSADGRTFAALAA